MLNEKSAKKSGEEPVGKGVKRRANFSGEQIRKATQSGVVMEKKKLSAGGRGEMMWSRLGCIDA